MGERFVVFAVVVAALGCDGASPTAWTGGSSGAAGFGGAGSGTGGAPSGTGGAVSGSSGVGGLSPDDSKGWNWRACGTIPSTEVSFGTQYEPGSAIAGGHPRVVGDSAWRVTGLAMSADRRTLVSMGGVTLAWDVASDFAMSRATYVSSARPEWPKVDVSPDGRWIAISGDGRRVVSRSGLQGAGFATSFQAAEPCFPIELRFSPDGEWLAGAGWTGAIDVFRMVDIEAVTATGYGEPQPTASLAAPCGEYPPGVRVAMRSSFTPDGRMLITEAGSRYATDDWQQAVVTPSIPAPHGLRGGFEVSAAGMSLVSDCVFNQASQVHDCSPHAAPFPEFSPEGHWIVAGATLHHVASGETRVLDPNALVGIFAPNGDVIAAGADNSLTRYCRVE